MGGPRSPQTLVHEGIYAIKVSMKIFYSKTQALYIATDGARTITHVMNSWIHSPGVLHYGKPCQ